MTYTVLRGNNRLSVQLWELNVNDLVLSTDQMFYPIATFPELKHVFPQLSTPLVTPPSLSELLRELGVIFLVGVGVYIVIGGLASLLAPQRNYKALTRSDRNYIRERDNEVCFYCMTYTPTGHVDHRVSRANGGSNDYDNLAWACAPCNWSKGSMNDTEFMSLFEL
jgi:hypothetical protein